MRAWCQARNLADDVRFHTPMRASHCGDNISDMEIQQETSCGGPKVCRTSPAARCLLTSYREFQLFLLGYIIIELCEIFTVGGFPLGSKVRMVKMYGSKRMSSSLIGQGIYRYPPGCHCGHIMGAADEWSCWLSIAG